MGIDAKRFKVNVLEELFCTICHLVLENPLQTPCEHVFCKDCITAWLSKEDSCPEDRRLITTSDLKPVPLILRSLLGNLEMTCEFANYGCEKAMRMNQMEGHSKECKFKPDDEVRCQQNCGAIFKRIDRKQHSCISYLRSILSTKESEIQSFRKAHKNLEKGLCDQQQVISALRHKVSRSEAVEEETDMSRVISKAENLLKDTRIGTLTHEIEELKQLLLVNGINKAQLRTKKKLNERLVEITSRVNLAEFVKTVNSGLLSRSPNGDKTKHHYLKRSRVEKLLQLVQNKLTEGATALEYNSEGYIATCMALMVGLNGQVTACKYQPQMLENTRKAIATRHEYLLTSGRIKLYRIFGFPFLEEGPFDVIVYNSEEIMDEHFVDALKPGGRAVSTYEIIDKFSDGSFRRRNHTAYD